jgi:methanogenic corrinoid protein MtbC1
MSSELMEPIVQAIAHLQPEQTAEGVRAALESGAQPVDIVDKGIAAGMEVVGERYQREEVFLPELLMAEQCMRSGLGAMEDYAGEDGATVAASAHQRLAERAASWMPALSSCVTRLLHSSDSFLKTA